MAFVNNESTVTNTPGTASYLEGAHAAETGIYLTVKRSLCNMQDRGTNGCMNYKSIDISPIDCNL